MELCNGVSHHGVGLAWRAACALGACALFATMTARMKERVYVSVRNTAKVSKRTKRVVWVVRNGIQTQDFGPCSLDHSLDLNFSNKSHKKE